MCDEIPTDAYFFQRVGNEVNGPKLTELDEIAPTIILAFGIARKLTMLAKFTVPFHLGSPFTIWKLLPLLFDCRSAST